MHDLQTKYYYFLIKLFKFETKIKIYPVDFTKPWYLFFWHEKVKFGLVFLIEILQAIYEAILPIAIGFAITESKFDFIILAILIYILLEILNRIALYLWHLATGNTQASILIAIQSFFLTTDPIHHATKSTGKIVSKIQAAGGRDFMVMMATFMFEILPIMVTYFTTTILLFKFDFKVGIVAFVFLIIITLVSSFLRYFHTKSLNEPWIKARDKYTANQVENLTQNALIRSIFATPEQINESTKTINKTITVRNIRNQGNSINVFIMRILYMISVLVITFMTFELLKTSQITAILATTLLLTYINGSRQILKIGDLVAQVTESQGNIEDMYKFINNFGKQTFPVLENTKNKFISSKPNEGK
jgi:ABC-type multidrug transport system fused ATPase/permease subunit